MARRHAPVCGLWLCLILIVHVQTPIVLAATHLRTGLVDAQEWDPQWLSSGHRRQLLGDSDCQDARWGVLCGRAQLLVQLKNGITSDDRKQLKDSLHLDGAAISGYIPRDTWLVVARPDDLRSPVYRQHAVLPYSPEYKIAPEWHPVLELVQQQHKQKVTSSADHSDAAAQHVQLHRSVLEHEVVQQLQLHPAAPSLHAAVHHTDAAAAELAHAPPAKLLIGVHFPDIERDELQQLGFVWDTFHPARAAAADWKGPLADLLAADGRCEHHLALCKPELLASSRWELEVAVCPQDLAEVVYWLSNRAAVQWLAPRPRLAFQNMVASMIVQDNGMSPTADYKAPDSHLFWEQNIDGKGQIVGIGDSGIDMHSCFFNDPENPFNPAPDATAWQNPNHRKVIYYWALADNNFKDLVGHGTHTSGSIAGIDPNDPTNKATGAAKSAKLVFADLSRTASGDVNAPQDLDSEYYSKLHEQGAYIFSDSWGSTSPVYDLQSNKADSFLYKNQDCVSHFAAGNYGANDDADTTITSPATAKNVVTVGATKSMIANYLSQTIAPVFMMSVQVNRQNKNNQYMSMRLVRADFGGDGSTLKGKGLKMVRAMPPNACGSLSDAGTGKYKDAIVLARRGDCFFSEKMAAGTAAGAAAVVVINDRAGGYFKMDAQQGEGAEKETITLLALPQRMGEQLWSLFDNADAISATIERYTDTWEAYEDIASFSSFGPTSDGRIKPDVVCPGELLSASSMDNDPSDTSTNVCAVGRKSGTSMATPMVAGHTAIVRQYFMEGFYPSGAANPADAHVPSGPLMKGVIMGGACDMKGNTEQYLPLEDSPSMRQGFGRLCLCSSLRLKSKCNANVQVVDRAPIANGETHRYCLRTMGGDVRIMLVWYDEPAKVNADATLVNDLDLAVTSAGMGGQKFFGNMGQQKDSLNTAERVWLKNVPAGGLDIAVTATVNSVFAQTQNYSLVVQGAFTGELASTHNPDKAAQAKVPGGCSTAQMQSVETPPSLTATAPLTMLTTPANVSGPQQESAPAADSNTTAATNATTEPDKSATRLKAPEPAASPLSAGPVDVPSPTPAPSPSPASPDNEALLGMLIGQMTGSPGSTATGTGTTGSPPGRRLTWVPNTPAAISVTVPGLVCHWLSASGLGPAYHHDQQEGPGGRTVLIPTSAVLAACVASLLLALMLFATYSLRKVRLSRTISLTSAVNDDLNINKLKAQAAAPADGSAAAAAAEGAAAGGLTTQHSLRSHSSCSTNSSSPDSLKEPISPTALAAALRAARSSTCPSGAGLGLPLAASSWPLTTSNSCPMPPAASRLSAGIPSPLSFTARHSVPGPASPSAAAAATADAAITLPPPVNTVFALCDSAAAAAVPSSGCVEGAEAGLVLGVAESLSLPSPTRTAGMLAQAADVLRRGSKSFTTGDRLRTPSWTTQQLLRQSLPEMHTSLGQCVMEEAQPDSSSITVLPPVQQRHRLQQQQRLPEHLQHECVTLPMGGSLGQQQQQHRAPRRASSYNTAVAFLAKQRQECEQQQQLPHQSHSGPMLLLHDDEQPRDQQGDC